MRMQTIKLMFLVLKEKENYSFLGLQIVSRSKIGKAPSEGVHTSGKSRALNTFEYETSLVVVTKSGGNIRASGNYAVT